MKTKIRINVTTEDGELIECANFTLEFDMAELAGHPKNQRAILAAGAQARVIGVDCARIMFARAR